MFRFLQSAKRQTSGRSLSFAAPAALVLLIASPSGLLAQTFDRVRLAGGGTQSGEIETISNTVVQVKQSTRRASVPVNEIQTIQFDGEPIELTQARSEIRRGDFEQALETLDKVRPADIRRKEIRDDFDFQKALAGARLAMASGNEQALRDAGRAMNEFVTLHKSSFHFFEAVELLGDMLAAVGLYDEAQQRYGMLAEAPWPEYKIRAAVLEGRTFAAQGKHAEAVRRFDDALAIETNDPAAAEQRLAARLGKAESQAETGEAAQAIQAIEQIIAEAEPEAIELQARAHNVLGRCHLKAGSPKEALYAFLYVDVLCSSAGEAHAEALYQLIPLYRTVGRDEDSRQTSERLLQRYPQSAWAERLNP